MSARVPDLAKLRQRRTDLAAELHDAEAALTAARAALADGSLKATAVASAQITRDVLVGALGDLDTTIKHVADLEAAERERAQYAAAVKHLVAVGADAERERARLVSLTAKACEALAPVFAEMSAAVDAWGAARAAWVATAGDLAPGLRQRPFGDSPWAVPGEAETTERLMRELGARGDLSAVLTRVLWLTPETTRDSTGGLGLPRDALTLGVFALFRQHFNSRDGHDRLQL